MAKKEVRIPIRVDGKEILLTQKQVKKLAKETTKAASGFDALGTSQRGADRAGKGLSRQSSNSTKNFSKMQQGISGGLVPAYATLAAQVFAVSAAFQFLQSSVNFKNLIEGQKAFGGVTGVAFGTITQAVRDATNGQLAYQDAAQAVAIGTASGLGRSQMEALGKAARDTSLALGRDLSDSFNRLIRGVTKAEPELLDELGIILRLDPALKAYATSISKTKEELNAFERTQAVFNEVAGQAEEKFGRITEIMDPQAFALAQFATAFDDLLNKLKFGLGAIAQTVLPFFTNNIAALTAALSLFAIPILKTILPSFDAMEKNAVLKLAGTRAALEETEKSMIDLGTAQAASDASPEERKRMRTSGNAGAKKYLRKAGVDIKGDLSQSQVAAYKRSMKTKTGIYKKFNKQEQIAFNAHLKKLDAVHKAETNKRVLREQIAEGKKQQAQKKTEILFVKSQIVMTRATAFAAKAMNTAMKAAGIIGVVVMIGSMLMGVVNFFRGVDEDAEKAKERIEGLTEVTKKLNEELGKSLQLRAEGLIAPGQYASQTGKMIGSASAQKMASDFANTANVQRRKKGGLDRKMVGNTAGRFKDNRFAANVDETAVAFRNLAAGSVGALSDAYTDLFETVKDGRAPTKAQIDNLAKLEGKYMGMATAVEQANEVQKAYDTALRGAVGPKRQFQSLRQASKTLLDTTKSQIAFNLQDRELAIKANKEAGGTGLSPKELQFYEDENKRLNDKFAANALLDGQLKLILEKEDQIATAKEKQKRIVLAISPLNTEANKIARANATIEDKKLAHEEQSLKIQVAQAQLTAARKTGTATEIADAEFNLNLQQDLFNTSEAQLANQIDKVALQKVEIANAQILKELGNEASIAGGFLSTHSAAFDSENQKFKGTKAFSMAKKAGQAQLQIDRLNADLEKKLGDLRSRKVHASETEIKQLDTLISLRKQETQAKIDAIEADKTLLGQSILAAEQAGIKALETGATNNIVGAIKGEKSGEEALKATGLAVAEAILQSIISSIVSATMAAFGVTAPTIVAAHTTGGSAAATAIQTALVLGGNAAAAAISAAMTAGAAAGAVASGAKFRYGYNPSMSSGSVVTGPQAGYNAILHGTEAVIPLGQGKKAIPVEFKNGGGGSTNNSVVNVTVNSDGSSQMTEDNATAFGKGIQAAIQTEIARQQRSGGLLDPNG